MAVDNQTGKVAKTENIQVRTGNTFRILFGGAEVGLLQDMRGSDDVSPEPASGIGDIHVTEYVPTMARHTISASSMILRSKSLREAGVAVENGDEALKGLVFTIEVFDKRDPGILLRKYSGVSYASGDVEIRKHAIIASNVQLNALDVTGVKI